VWASPNTNNIRSNQLSSSKIGGMIGDPSFSTTAAMHTYLLDWQPGYIRWYIQGVLVDQLTVSQGAIPSRPMYTVISLWTQTNPNDCLWFGGCLPFDNTLTYKAYFADYKRVRCYDPKAPYFDTTSAAGAVGAPKYPSPPTCKYASTANTNTYYVTVRSTGSWGYVRRQLTSVLLRVYKKYGATDLHPTISGPVQAAARGGLPTTWKLTVVVPVKRCAAYKESLRNALRAAIKVFKELPTVLGTTIVKFT
jgi:hypothetical protein